MDSAICPNEVPEDFINHHLTFIPLDEEGRPIVSSSIFMSIFEVGADDQSPLLSNGALNNRGAMTARVLRNQSSDVTLERGSVYRLRVSDRDANVDVASVLQLSQIPGRGYQEELLTLEPDETTGIGEVNFQTTLFIVPGQQ